MVCYVFIALQIAGTNTPESNLHRIGWSITVAEATGQQQEGAAHVALQWGAR